MPGDRNLFAVLNEVEQLAQLVFGVESADHAHGDILYLA
jgi:hypothetical protein